MIATCRGKESCAQCEWLFSIPPSSDVRTLSISPCIKDVDASSRSLLIKSTTLQAAAGEMSDRFSSMLARILAGTIRTPTESCRPRPLVGKAAKGEGEAERVTGGWQGLGDRSTHLREHRVRISLRLSISDTIPLIEIRISAPNTSSLSLQIPILSSVGLALQ